MKRHVLLFGLIGGVLVAVLKWTEYQFLVVEHSFEIYGALTAATFAGLGIWLGIRLTGTRQKIAAGKPALPTAAPVALVTADQTAQSGEAAFVPDERRRDNLGITRRELEILELVAQGMSNREIAGKLYVSENTVKTHCSHAFDKLGAKRRTQAVQMGKEFGLLR
jgi:ATP/maltotriose-dependent transcriptional regulator MalT